MPFGSYIRFPAQAAGVAACQIGSPPAEECQSRNDDVTACLAPVTPTPEAVTGCLWRYQAKVPEDMEKDYERIHAEVSREIIAKYSSNPAEGIVAGLARYADSIDPRLYAALLKTLSEEYGIDLKGQMADAINSYRQAIEDDHEFIERAAKLLDALNLDDDFRAGTLSLVLFHVRETASKDPSIAVPLFRQNGYDDNICEALKKKKPELFEHLLKTNQAFFRNVEFFHPEWISEEVAIEAVKIDGSLYETLPNDLKKRDDIIDSAVRTGKCPLNRIPPKKLTDERIMASLTADPKSIGTLGHYSILSQSFVSGNLPKLRTYEEYCVTACKKDGMALGAIPEKFRTPAMLDAAIAGNNRALAYVIDYYNCERYKNVKGDPYEGYKKDLIGEIRKDPSLYAEISDNNLAKYEPDVMKAAIEDEKNARYILANFNARKEVVVAIVSKNGLMLQYVNDRYKNDFEVVEAAVRQNPEAIFFTDMKFAPRLRKYLINNERTKALFALPKRKITPGRFMSKTDERMAEANRVAAEAEIRAHPGHPRHPGKPIALYLYPVSDYNHAFNADSVHRMEKEGYQVIYYEYANETEYTNVIGFYLPMLERGDAVVVAGHGTRTSMDGSENEGEYGRVDLSDEKMFLNMLPKTEIPEGVHFIADSCSNAAGGPDADNMMNMHYRVFRKKWHVYAAEDDNHLYIKGADADSISLTDLHSESLAIYHKLPHDAGTVKTMASKKEGIPIYYKDLEEAKREDFAVFYYMAEKFGEAVKDTMKDGLSLLLGSSGPETDPA